MEQRESSERKSFLIKVILLAILLLLSFLATVLYVFLYPKTTIVLYDNGEAFYEYKVKKYSKLDNVPTPEKPGHTFLYWSYNDYGGEELDPTVEVEDDVIRLYANYEVNSYWIHYYISYLNEETGRYDFYHDVNGCRCREWKYGTPITLPTGMVDGKLIPELSNKPGYHFVGWTTKVIEEDDPEVNNYLKLAGSQFVLDVPAHVSLFAYWEKDSYTVNLHTGIDYVLDNNNQPIKDANGDYVIRNISTADDPYNEQESVVRDKIKYLSQLTNLTDAYADFKLNEKNGGVAHSEYEFKGWYFDPEYKFAVNDYVTTVKIDDNGRPYLSYTNDNLNFGKFDSVISGYDTDNKPIYEFDLYSKWERKSYTINFANGEVKTKGKMQPIQLYRLILDEEGKIAEEYGKYYDDGYYSYEGAMNGGHYSRINFNPTLANNLFVTQEFQDSNNGYRLIQWTDAMRVKDSSSAYAVWTQDPWSEDLGKVQTTGAISYANSTYVHTVSESKTFYSQWSQVYSITLKDSETGNSVIVKGIKNEWFFLPNMERLKNLTGKEWKVKNFCYFAGWKTGSSSLSTKYLEKLEDGSLNSEFYYTIKSNVTLYIHWLNTPYTLNFYLNDDTSNIYTTMSPVYGGDVGSVYKFPVAPTREGYIFDGWSKNPYEEGEYAGKIRSKEVIDDDDVVYKAGTNLRVYGDQDYYASWTIDYKIVYDANGGVFTRGADKKEIKYSDWLKKSTATTYDLRMTLKVGENINVKKDNYEFVDWYVGSDDSVTLPNRTTFDLYEKKYYSSRSSSVVVPDADKTAFSISADNTIVIKAKWEPVKFTITIWDTMAEQSQAAKRLFQVAYSDDPSDVFTFPKENGLGQKYNEAHKGYEITGFALDRDGVEGFREYNEETMPTIQCSTLTGSLEYYAIYVEKSINVKYCFKKTTGSGDIIVDYTPTNPLVTVGSVPYLSTIIALPKVTGADYGDTKYLFKYWYYEDDNGQEVKVYAGDKVKYCDQDNNLIIYAKFEVDEYQISLNVMDPYTNTLIENVKLFSVEVGQEITQDIYDEVIDTVREIVTKSLSQYVLDADKLILKGYSLENLFTQGGYTDIFAVGKLFNSNHFQILAVTTSGMTLQTKWAPSEVKIVYKNSESVDAESVTQGEINYASEVVLKSKEAFTFTGGQFVHNWYIIDPTNTDNATNRTFFDCNTKLVGLGGKYASLHNMLKYIEWDENGVGTLVIYANVKQTCRVNYYKPNVLGGVDFVGFVEFVYGEQIPELMDSSSVVSGDLKFEGWYYLGNKISSIPVTQDKYVVDIYANFTFDVTYKIIRISNNTMSEEVYSVETVSLLQGYDTETKTYNYLTFYTINVDKIPQLAGSDIPEGYEYYGLKHNEEVYSLESINNEVSVAVTGSNLEFTTYYTKVYTLTYSLLDKSQELFEDGTSIDKVYTFKVGFDGVSLEEVKIAHQATKAGYEFSGWQIRKDDGNLDPNIYEFNDVIILSTLNTTLVPAFNAPEAGDIDVTIKYVHGLNGDTTTEPEYLKNGDSFTFKDGATFGWTNNKYELYAWKDVDGNVYYVNDNNYKYTIPLAIADTTIQFTGLWQPTYSINFEQPDNYKDLATYSTKTIKLYQYDRNKMIDSNANKFKFVLTEVPTTSITGIEFKYWTYNNNGEIVNIPVGSTIYIGTSTFQKNQLLDGTYEYYLPTPESGTWSRDLIGAWSAIEYDVVLYVTDPTNHSTIKYTILPNNTGKVEFNTTYSTRELLTSEVLAYEVETTYGIIGWSTTQGATSVDEDILKEIRSDLTLYSVWSKKVSVKFASTDNIKFLDAGNHPVEEIVINNCVPNDTLDINNVIKSIYQVGYMTVYYENGQAKIISGATNDYYQVVGFTCSWGGDLTIGANNTFSSIKIQSSDMTLTPITERVYQVKFFDNTTSAGGYQVTSLPTKYYRSSETNTVNLDVENYKFVTRAGFTLEGWNTDETLETILTGDYLINDDLEFYAIWSSDRSINFVTQLNNSSMYTYLIENFKLTKDNKIDVELLKTYLGDPDKSNGLTALTGDVLSNHPAYTLSKQNLYLDGFIIVDNNGHSTIYDIDDLDTIDFGSANYYSTEDITINLLFQDIFTTVYSNGDKTGIVGTMSAPDYFVSLDSVRTGKLLSDGTIGDYVLPTPALTRPNYDLYGWSTVSLDGGQFGTRYSFDNIDDLTLTKDEIIAIVDSLKNVSSQTYNLYSNWESAYIDIYVYTLAEVIDNPSGEDTTLLDPYAYYAASSDGKDIPFANTAKFINVGGYPIYYNNYDFNKSVDTKIAQLQYGREFTLSTNSISNIVSGYELLGWSKTLHKLGEVGGNYFAIGDLIQVIDTNIVDGAIKLYPVYGYATKDLEITTTYGTASVEFTTSIAVSGFVDSVDSISTVTIPSNSATTIKVTRATNITITAVDPENTNYIFDHFVGLGSTDNAAPLVRTISGLSYVTTNQLNYVNVIFAPKKVAVNITIEYDYDVKDESRETTQIAISGITTSDSTFNTNLGIDNQSYSVEVLATSDLSYVINNNSGLYEYVLFSDLDKIVVANNKLSVSSLNIGSTPNTNGAYTANLTIKAMVSTYKVTFYMSKGALNADTKLSATNSIFDGVDNFDIVDNVAEVVLGSVITLPTASDISYTSGGAFLGFYLNGDSSRTHITTHTVNTNVAFIEDYADYSYNIYYKYKNGTKHITGLTHGSSYTIGVTEAIVPGYVISYWGDEQGNKIFDDGQTITMTRSYNLFAQYEALTLTLKYVYSGNDSGRIETIKFDEDFVTLSQEELSDLNISDDKFIAGWKFGEKLLGVGDSISFDELEYTYDNNNTELILEAVYYNRYQYIVSYDTSKISNPGDFTSSEMIVKAKDSAGTIDEKTLQYTIIDKIPLNTNTDYSYTKYLVKYSVDNGQSYSVLDTGDNAVPGATIVLNDPTTTGATLGVPVLVILEPQYENNVVYADVTYVITNPNTGDSLYEGNYEFDPRYSLTNVYLPNIVDITTVENAGKTNEPNNSANWQIQVLGTNFTTTVDTIDFYKYTLVGYLIEFYESGVATGVTQTINFTDSSSASSRKVLGSTEFTIKTIWQSVKVVKYYDADDKEMTELREYVDISIYSNIVLKSIADIDDSYNMSKDGYSLVGWQTVKVDVDDSTDYYPFASYVVTDDYSFYPAFSRNYAIKVETVGVLDEDLSKFVYNDSHGAAPTYVYFGMNSSNSIDLTGYSYNRVYSEYDDVRYAFVGYSETENGDIAENFTFSSSNISEDYYIFYAHWSKQSSRVAIKFEAYNNNSATNIANSYSLAPKSYDNNYIINLSYNYSEGSYTFEDSDLTDAVNEFLMDYPYFTIDKIVIAGTEQNITSHIVSADIEITIKFAPIYRIKYILPEGASITGFNETNAFNVTNGMTFDNQYSVGLVDWEGYTPTGWAYTSAIDNTKVAMYDANDQTTINISRYQLTPQYVIELELMYVTAYTVNLYYFTSAEKINEYNIALAADPNMSIANKQSYYDNSVSISIPRGDVAYSSAGTLFDSVLMSRGYTSFANLLTSLESEGFTSIGLVTIDNLANKYSVIKSKDYTEYFAKTYTIGSDTNNLFLEYSPIVYEIQFSTVVVDVDGNYNEDLQDVNFAIASYTYGETKTFGYNPYVEHLTHLNSVNLSAESSAAYEFVGWKVLDGNTLVDIDAGMLKNTILSGFNENMHFVAVFKEKFVTATATIYSDNDFGHKLSVKITSYLDNGKIVDTITPLSIDSEVADEDQFKNTITFTLPFMRYVTFEDSNKNDSFDISTVSCNGATYASNRVFDVSYVTVDGKADFTINYSAKPTTLYISTCGPELGDNSSLGQLDKVKYKYYGIDKLVSPTPNSNTIKIGNKNVTFNYQAQIVNGATITNAFTTIPVLNYTYKWMYLDGNTLKDLPDSMDVIQNTYIVAVYTPNEVTVDFYVDDIKISGISSMIVDYGTTIKLPTAVVEFENSISVGWIYNDIQYSFGDELKITSASQIESINIYARCVDRAYVTYSAGDTGFTIPNSYPASATDSSIVVAEDINVSSDYYYARIDRAMEDATAVAVSETTGSLVRSNKLVIPSTAISPLFTNWISKSNKDYVLGATYTYSVDDNVSGVITLTAHKSDNVEVRFYITDPSNADTQIFQATNTSTDYISLIIDKNNIKNFLYLESTTASSAKFRDKISITTYEVNSTKIQSNYKLFGWSTEQKSSYSDIAQAVNEHTISIINSSYETMTKDQILAAFIEFLGKADILSLIESNNGILSLYTVWETKFEVTFQVNTILNDEIVTTGLFAKGDVITIPTNEDVTVVIPESKHWAGWTDGVNYYLFGGTIKTFTVPGGKNITFSPYFTDLYTLTFDTNFSSVKEKVAASLDSYAESKSAEEIESAIGKPNYTGSITLDNYQIKNLSPKAQTDLSKITLSDSGIYPTTITLAGATWEDSYFDFLGWATSATSADVIKSSKYQISENTTLYAVWKARTFTINMYETYDLANAQGATDNNETVEFGSHFSAPENPFEKANADFNRWLPIAPMTDNILNIGAVIVNDLYIYPAYDNVYTVRFKNSLGDDLFTDRAALKVSDGDTIDYYSYLPDLDKVQLTQIYYEKVDSSVDGWASPVELYTISDGKVVVTKDPLEFVDPKFSAENNGDFVINIENGIEYFTIYVDIIYSIDLNYPDYPINANSPVVNDPIDSLILGETYSVGEYVFDATQYGPDVTFGGWYLNNDFSADVISFKVVYEGGEIKLISGPVSMPMTTLDAIDLYAKVLVTVTITLGHDEDESISKYATLEYNNISDTEKNYISIVNSSLKSVTYTTIYNSTYHPVFAIKLSQGYQLTQDSKDALDELDGIDELTVFKEKTATDNVWKYSYEDITIGSLTAGITKVNLFVETIKITVVYDYAVGDETLQYKTHDSEVWQDYNYENGSYTHTLSDTTRHFDGEHYVVDNDKKVFASDTITLEYTHDITKGIITYTNVPYGAKLYIQSVPNSDKYINEPTWIVGYKNAEDKLISVTVPMANNNSITYAPEIAETTYYAKTTLHSNVGLNVQLYLDIEKDDAVSVWGNAINNATGLDTIYDSSFNIIKYRIKFDLYSYAKFVSGNSITADMINEWNSAYHSEYDSPVNENTQGGISIKFLLQYFWFNDDTPWKLADGSDIGVDSPIIFASKETVNLYHTLSRAVVINVAHQTTHFDNDTIYSVDRADLSLEYTAPANSVEFSQDSESLIVKVPYNQTSSNALTVTVDPADAVTDKHNAYKVKNWKFANSEKDGTGTLSNETSQSITLDTNFNEKFFKEINLGVFPEVDLVAQVCVESHTAKFVNYSNDTDAEITIELGYDTDIVDNQYNQKLASLTEQSIIPQMSQFKYVGDDIYIFLGWIDTSTSEIFPVDEIIREDKIFEPKYINLSDLDEEYKNLFIKLTVGVYEQDDDGIVLRTMTAYLPKGDEFTDAFGTAYNFDINNAIGTYVNNEGKTIKTLVKDFVADVSGYKPSAYTFYISANVEGTLANVITNIDNDQDVIVYPAIPVKLTTSYLHNIAELSTLTYDTLGGKIELTCDAKGNLILKNLTDSDVTINYASEETYTFAYWLAGTNLFNETTRNAYTTNGETIIPVLAWYNPRFKAMTANFSSTHTSWTDIISDAPTGINIAGGNYIIKYDSFTFVDGRPQAIVLIQDYSGKTLHTIQYLYNLVVSSGIEIIIITPADSATLSLGGEYQINDEYGYINIEATISEEDFITIDFIGFTITNATDNLTAFNGSYLYSSDKKFSTSSTVEIIDGKTIKIGDVTIKASAVVGYEFLEDYLTNFRWQYQKASTWYDIPSGFKLSTSSTIRLAADWITKNVTFAKLSSIDTTKLTSTEVDGRDLYAGDLTGGLEYIHYYINGNDTITIQLYKGEELQYSMSKKMFTIVTSGDFIEDQEIVSSIRDDQTVYIESTYGYVQGWLYDSDNSQNRINLQIVSRTFSYEESSIFWAWCEDTIKIHIRADTQTYTDVVNGYGQVSYMIDDVSSDTELLTAKCTVDGSYAEIKLGVASKLNLIASEHSDYNHQFVNYKDYYHQVISTDRQSEFLPYNIDMYISALKFIYVLFDADYEGCEGKSKFDIKFKHDNPIKEGDNTIVTIPMYTGGTIVFTDSSTANDSFLTVQAYQPFSKNCSSILISLDQNILYSTLPTGTTIYPCYGFQFETIQREKGSDTKTVLEGGILTTISSEILIASDAGVTITLTENLPSVLVVANIKYIAPDGTISKSSLSSSSPYIYADDLVYSQICEVDPTSYCAQLEYNLNAGGISAFVSVDYGYSIRPKAGYSLVCASFYPAADTDEANICSYPTNANINSNSKMSVTGNEQIIDLDTYKYNLLITVERKEKIDIAFEFALLDSDMDTLDVQVSQGANIEFATVEDATESGANWNKFTVSAPIKWSGSTPTYPYVLTEVSSGRNYVKVYDGEKKLVAEISYVSHIDYINDAWRLEQSESSQSSLGHLALHKVTDPYSRIVTRSSDGGTAATAITTSTTLEYDCTILLDVERKPIKITIDDHYWLNYYEEAYSEEKYWNANDWSPEIALLRDAINRVTSGYVINTYTGLVDLTFPDNLYDESRDSTSYYAPHIVNQEVEIIKLGYVEIKNKETGEVITRNPFSTRSDGDDVLHPAFAILNDQSVTFNSSLSGAYNWMLVSVPYGDSATLVSRQEDGEDIYNFWQLQFHSGEYGSSGSYCIDIPFDTSSLMNLVRDPLGYNNIVYFYKDKYTRLYSGMYTTEEYMNNYVSQGQGYGSLEFTFRDSDYSPKLLIAGFKVTEWGAPMLFDGANKMQYNWSTLDSYEPYRGFVNVYPIFAEQVELIKITIKEMVGGAANDVYTGTFTGYANEYYVPKGTVFGRSFADLDYTAIGSDYEYTKKSPLGNYVFLGLTTTDLDGNFNLLNYDGSSVSKHDYSSSDAETRYRGSAGLAYGQFVYNSSSDSYVWNGNYDRSYTISLVATHDVTFTQVWAEYGRDITYDRMYKNRYKEIVHDIVTTHYNTITYSDMPMPIKPYTTLPSACPAQYFSIGGYYFDYSDTSGFIDDCGSQVYLYSDTTIYVDVIHDNCALSMSDGDYCAWSADDGWSGEALMAEILPDYQLNPCQIYVLMNYTCTFCGKSEAGAETSAQGIIHQGFVPYDMSGNMNLGVSDYKYDETQHWKMGKCTTCGATNIGGDYEKHTLGAEQAGSLYHATYCTKQCGYESRTDHILIPGSEYTEHNNWDNDPGIIQCYLKGECSLCNKIFTVKALRDVYDEEYIPCVAGEKAVRHCRYCNITNRSDNYEPLNHPSSQIVKFDATCTVDGGVYRICKNCGDCLYEQVYPAGHTAITIVNTKMPTCTENGYEREHCAACGWWSTESIVIPKYGHQLRYVSSFEARNDTGDPLLANYCTVSYWDYECVRYGCDHTERHIYGEDYHELPAVAWSEIQYSFRSISNDTMTYSFAYANKSIIETRCAYCKKYIGNHKLTTLTKANFEQEQTIDDWYIIAGEHCNGGLLGHKFTNTNSYPSEDTIYDTNHCVGYTFTTYVCLNSACNYKIITNRTYHCFNSRLVSCAKKSDRTKRFTVSEMMSIIEEYCGENWDYIADHPNITYAQIIGKMNTDENCDYIIDPSLAYYCPHCKEYYDNNLFMTYNAFEETSPTSMIYPEHWIKCSNPDTLGNHNCNEYATLISRDTSKLYFDDDYTSQQPNICVYASYYRQCFACAVCGKNTNKAPTVNTKYVHTSEEYHLVNVYVFDEVYTKNGRYCANVMGKCIRCGAICFSDNQEITKEDFNMLQNNIGKVLIYEAPWWINKGAYDENIFYCCDEPKCFGSEMMCQASCRRRFR